MENASTLEVGKWISIFGSGRTVNKEKTIFNTPNSSGGSITNIEVDSMTKRGWRQDGSFVGRRFVNRGKLAGRFEGIITGAPEFDRVVSDGW